MGKLIAQVKEVYILTQKCSARNKLLHGRFYKHKFPVIIGVSFPESTKVQADAGLIVLDCRKEKEDTESHKIVELYDFLKDSSRD